MCDVTHDDEQQSTCRDADAEEKVRGDIIVRTLRGSGKSKTTYTFFHLSDYCGKISKYKVKLLMQALRLTHV